MTMRAQVIDVRTAEDSRDVVHRAVQVLAEGRLAALPTETVYGLAASALDEAAVERLMRVKGRKSGHALTLAIKSAEEARDYVPDMSPLAERLARRCWPGPVTLVFEDSHPEGLVRRLPPRVQRAVSPRNTVGLRVPGHPMPLDVLDMLAGPLVLTSANPSGAPDPVSAAEVLRGLGRKIDLVLDDGPCRFGQPSTVVRVGREGFEILRAGVVPEPTLRRLASLMILMVCTGNTCRSPLAEVLARRRLARRLGCQDEELEARGVMVLSAGVAAMPGGRASPLAVQTAAELGLDLSRHETQPVSASLVRQADVIYVMTRAHRDALLVQWPEAAERTWLLSPDGADIADPIGGEVERYRQCVRQIDNALAQRLEEVEIR